MEVWELLAYLKPSQNNKILFEGERGLDEYQIIRQYFSGIGSHYLKEQGIKLSIGDDAAVIDIPQGKESVQSIDTSLSGIHFFDWMHPRDIAYRAVAVALSDLAACGATPSWYMLSITINNVSHKWLNSFREGLEDISEEYKIPLIGGDTTKGSLSVTVQVGGYVDAGKSISRKGAKVGDLIFITGFIGEAAKELKYLKEKYKIPEARTSSYLRPKVRISVGEELREVASAAIDVSDGLIQDLNHICDINDVGANVYLEDIPCSKEETIKAEFINEGDDYEICFTAHFSVKQSIFQISQKLEVPITEIGKIINGGGVNVISRSGQQVNLKHGYKHF